MTDKRPPVRKICYISAEGNPHTFTVGDVLIKGKAVTELRETHECPEPYCSVSWIEVWAGEQLIARFNQSKLEHIFYV